MNLGNRGRVGIASLQGTAYLVAAESHNNNLPEVWDGRDAHAGLTRRATGVALTRETHSFFAMGTKNERSQSIVVEGFCAPSLARCPTRR